MKHLAVLFMFLTLQVCVLRTASADFSTGVAAYKRGDFKIAFKVFKKSAQQGHTGGQYNLGYMYYNGRGVPQDYVQAAKWYRKAADQGYALAQSNLGRIYDDGQGVPQDYVLAAKWLRKAAKQGNVDAQFTLLINRNLVKVNAMYRKGLGVPKTKPGGEVVVQDRDAGPRRIR